MSDSSRLQRDPATDLRLLLERVKESLVLPPVERQHALAEIPQISRVEAEAEVVRTLETARNPGQSFANAILHVDEGLLRDVDCEIGNGFVVLVRLSCAEVAILKCADRCGYEKR